MTQLVLVGFSTDRVCLLLLPGIWLCMLLLQGFFPPLLDNGTILAHCYRLCL